MRTRSTVAVVGAVTVLVVVSTLAGSPANTPEPSCGDGQAVWSEPGPIRSFEGSTADAIAVALPGTDPSAFTTVDDAGGRLVMTDGVTWVTLTDNGPGYRVDTIQRCTDVVVVATVAP